MADLPPRAWELLEDSGVEFGSAVSPRGGSGAVLSFNLQDPVFANADLRKAVFQAIDPWNYVDTIWSGQGFPSVGMPVSEADWLLGKDEARGEYFADPSMARRLLEKADAGSGEIQLAVWSEPGGQIYTDLGDRIAGDLEGRGIQCIRAETQPGPISQHGHGAGEGLSGGVGGYAAGHHHQWFFAGAVAQWRPVESCQPCGRGIGRHDRGPSGGFQPEIP